MIGHVTLDVVTHKADSWLAQLQDGESFFDGDTPIKS